MQKDDKGKGPYGVRVTCANMQMKYNNILSSLVLMILLLLPNLFSLQISFAQQIITQDQDLVTYSGQSNFIKEFEVPVVKEKGLRGITTDAQGNVWFYHSTNKTSTAIKLEPDTGKFTAYDIKGDTVVDNAVINLAGGQLVFDDKRNVVWFTDVRTNSIGRLDVKSEKVELIKIPTPRSGPLGIVLSPHDGGKSIWFAEITGDKIARLDPESNNRIIEYSTGENSGPSLLTFDSKGILWTSLSYANSILRAETSKLVPGSSAAGMSTITLSKPDTFSPFGIAIVDVADANDDTASRGNQKIFVSDHGSSRVISADVPQNDGSNTISLNPQSYMSYWTSPSSAYPTTLATQIVTDKQGKNIYFPQHIGNRISKIDTKTGIMTEYDIPTGPLSTTLFAAVSDDGKKVWFTEWASNKVGNLDTTVPVPFDLEVRNNNQTIITLDKNGSKSLDILLKAEGNNGNLGVSIDEVGLAVVGMSDSGLKGVTYT
ncbi:MAG: virginiamycin B lyase family protein, partial [Nitrososphaera sp.]